MGNKPTKLYDGIPTKKKRERRGKIGKGKMTKEKKKEKKEKGRKTLPFSTKRSGAKEIEIHCCDTRKFFKSEMLLKIFLSSRKRCKVGNPGIQYWI